MSTSEQNLRTTPPHPMVRTNTTARTIQGELTDSRLIPVDMRTHRYGYNPALMVREDPYITGQQISLMEPGVAILFETGPALRPRNSVDPMETRPLTMPAEILAGEGLFALIYKHEHMGVCELEPLRGADEDAVGRAMDVVHAPFAQLVEQKLIPKCPFEREVCVSCRLAALKAIKASVPDALVPLYAALVTSNQRAYNHIRGEWNQWIGEVAAMKVNPSGRGLREIGDNQTLFMQHLHEHAPSDAELVKIGLQSQGMGEALKEGLSAFAKEILAKKEDPEPGAREEVKALQAQLNVMQAQYADLMDYVRQNIAAQPAAAAEDVSVAEPVDEPDEQSQ